MPGMAATGCGASDCWRCQYRALLRPRDGVCTCLSRSRRSSRVIEEPWRTRRPMARPHGPRLSPFALLHHFVDLAFDRFEVERGGRLHGRKIDRCLRQGEDLSLHLDETPELAGKETVGVTRGRVVPGLATQRGRPLERVLAKVDDTWHVRGGLFVRPAQSLLVELELEIINADSAKLRSTEVPDLVALRWPF